MTRGSGGAACATPDVDLVGARVLVTGAGGFIGHRLCQQLQTIGAEVVAVARRAGCCDDVAAETHVVDLLDHDALGQLMRNARADHVVHLAALRERSAMLADYPRSYSANLLSTLDLAEAVLASGSCRRFVYLGSAEEYGRAAAPFGAFTKEVPLTAYGLSKLAATQLLQALAITHGLPVVLLRATVVFGPGQKDAMFVPALLHSLLRRERFPMTDGEQKRDFIYVDDVIDGIIRSLVTTSAHDEVLHLSSGTPVTIRELALLAAKLIGGKSESLLGFGSIAYGTGEAMEYWADNANTRVALGWVPQTTLEDGLALTISHLRRMGVGQ